MKLFIILLLLVSVTWANEIRIIGVDTKGNVLTNSVSKNKYIQILKNTKKAFDLQLINKAYEFNENKHWSLKKISLGLGLRGEIGLGPFKIGKYFRQRFIYTR